MASIADRIKEYLDAATIGQNDRRHLEGNIAEEKRGLNRLVNKYHEDGCDEDDDFKNMKRELKQLHRPLPPPVLEENPWKKKFERFCENEKEGAKIWWKAFVDASQHNPWNGSPGPLSFDPGPIFEP